MKRDSYHEHLKQVPLFDGLDHHDLDVVAKAVTELTLKAGTVLMKEGTASLEMVIVLDGTLVVTEDGAEIATIGPGSFAGEIGLLAHKSRTAKVTAQTDVTVLHIDSRSFQAVLEEAPMIAVHMLPIVATRVIENNARHTD